jgi:N-acetylmuramoyl-L-alanine amidase CwlA
MAKTISTGFITDKVNGIKISSAYKCNVTNYEAFSRRGVNYIVVHYTGNKKDTAKANANYFRGANRNASAHFFVDNTHIYQSVALVNKAWHCGGYTYYHSYCRNTNSIGIEMCCTAGNYRVSEKTILNTAHLVANLCRRLDISVDEVDKYVLRHYDVTHKQCPKQMSDGGAKDKDWIAFKAQVKEILGGATAKEKKSTIKIVNYKVRVNADVLNIRKGPGTSYKIVNTITDKGVYTIVKKSGSWGYLKSGMGWIYLGYTSVVK